MAQFLASLTTLGNLKAQIRGQLGAVSEQESGILTIEMTDIIHQAITNLRTVLGSIINDFYRTKGTISPTGTTPNYSASIAALEISDIHDLALFNSTFGEIPIFSLKKYNAYRSLYSSTDVGTTKAFAAVANTETALATQSVLTLYVYSGAATATPLASTEFSYTRVPKKVTVDANTIDLPEVYVPLVRDIATIYVQKRLDRTPSADVINAIKNTLDPLVALGVSDNNSMVRK